MFNLKSIFGSQSVKASVKEANAVLVEKAKAAKAPVVTNVGEISYEGLSNDQILLADKAAKAIAEANSLALAQAKAKALAEENARKLQALMDTRDKALSNLAASNRAVQEAVEKEVLVEIMLQESSEPAAERLATLKSQAVINRDEIKRRLMSKAGSAGSAGSAVSTAVWGPIPEELKKPFAAPAASATTGDSVATPVTPADSLAVQGVGNSIPGTQVVTEEVTDF